VAEVLHVLGSALLSYEAEDLVGSLAPQGRRSIGAEHFPRLAEPPFTRVTWLADRTVGRH
jgi:hypothetical protein